MHHINRKEQIKSSLSGKSFFKQHNIYPRLRINQPDDKYEQAADAMAERVLTLPENTKLNASKGDENSNESIHNKSLNTATALQKKYENGNEKDETDLEGDDLQRQEEEKEQESAFTKVSAKKDKSTFTKATADEISIQAKTDRHGSQI